MFHFTPSNPDQTCLCSEHYRALYKSLNPEHYQQNCAVCSSTIKNNNYRTCTEHKLFENHLKLHTDFQGTLSACQKLCMACYRFNLTVVKQMKMKSTSTTTDDDFESTIRSIQTSLPTLPCTISDESQLIEMALAFTIIGIAQDLKEDKATSLPCAYSCYLDNIDMLFSMSTLSSCPRHGTPRWLLAQLSTRLKHHVAYTCIVKKHGIIIYRPGRELSCLSNALFQARVSKKSKVSAGMREINKKTSLILTSGRLFAFSLVVVQMRIT